MNILNQDNLLEFGDDMKYELKEVNNKMGFKEYIMYQEIPYEENGAYNYAKGLSYHNYKEFLKEKEEEKMIKLTEKDTPRISYIFYVDDEPVGEIAIRPVLNDYWKIYSGNIGYKIRPSKRNQGFGTMMLKYALEECKSLNMHNVLLQTNLENTFSQKVIENNGGRLVEAKDNTCFYEIKL